MSRILVTGAAGFIGAHVAAQLARDGHDVVGLDNFNGYYDPRLKPARVAALLAPAGVDCQTHDLADAVATVAALRRLDRIDCVVHLAAQAGVRNSIREPLAYVQANVTGFVSLLEACRLMDVSHLLYASSSSVYGARTATPFAEDDRTDEPVSVYAATKKASEALAHAYASVHGMALTGLRFFTVYGPWGRPDMAYFSFAQAIRRGEPITVFAGGELRRDFTCIVDTVEAVRRLVARGPGPAAAGGAKAEVFNVGHHEPVRVLDFIGALEAALGRRAIVEFAPMQPGDVPVTCADPRWLEAAIGRWDWTPLADGLAEFAAWLARWDAAPAPASQARRL